MSECCIGHQRCMPRRGDCHIEPERPQLSLHTRDIGMLDVKAHQHRTLRCGTRRMWRRPPIDEERDDAAGHERLRIGEAPRQRHAVRALPGRRLHLAELHALLRRTAPKRDEVMRLDRPRRQSRSADRIDAEPSAGGRWRLVRIRRDDLHIDIGSEG